MSRQRSVDPERGNFDLELLFDAYFPRIEKGPAALEHVAARLAKPSCCCEGTVARLHGGLSTGPVTAAGKADLP